MVTRRTSAPTSGVRRAPSPITAGTSITSQTRSRANPRTAVDQKILAGLSPERRAFATQISRNVQRTTRSITAATNTSNIAAKPSFLELLPLFVQKLLILDVYGSVAMNSRLQIVPYFKVVAEQTKGETAKGTILNTPFVNRQGVDPNFTGRVVKNEILESAAGSFSGAGLQYTPVLPGSVTIASNIGGVTTPYTDDGNGNLLNTTGATIGAINYATGEFTLTTAITLGAGDNVTALAYQFDNETVGPNTDGQYGAKMGKFYLDLSEFHLEAEAHMLSCYSSIFSAFAANAEYGANLSEISREAAIGEITAEINTKGFLRLAESATYSPQYNWNAAPILSGSVVPNDYSQTLRLQLERAAQSVFQTTRLGTPNRLTVGTSAAVYIQNLNGFNGALATEAVGPYKLGSVGNFEVTVCPDYDPDLWVMNCKSDDLRRNSGLFGEYMPIMSTDEIGLADATLQRGFATMYAMKVVNPATVVSGRILGTY